MFLFAALAAAVHVNVKSLRYFNGTDYLQEAFGQAFRSESQYLAISEEAVSGGIWTRGIACDHEIHVEPYVNVSGKHIRPNCLVMNAFYHESSRHRALFDQGDFASEFEMENEFCDGGFWSVVSLDTFVYRCAPKIFFALGAGALFHQKMAWGSTFVNLCKFFKFSCQCSPSSERSFREDLT